jgi:hypothetical protein
VSELARPFDMTLPALKNAAMWIDDYRHHQEQRPDHLDGCLHKAHAKTQTPKNRARKKTSAPNR